MKYVMIKTMKNSYDQFIKEFDSFVEATQYCVSFFDSMCNNDKCNLEELYILESVNSDVEANNHLDGNIVFMLA